jgi:single-strand DNA-binding protein
MSLNVVMVMGRLTRDPDLSQTGGGKPVAQMRLAVPRYPVGRAERRADFVDVVVYEGLATVCARHLRKGRRVGVVGRLAHEEWESQAGERRQRLTIVAREVDFLDAPAGDTSDEPDHDEIPAAA